MTLRQWRMVIVALALTAGTVLAAAPPKREEHIYSFQAFRAAMESPARAKWQKPDEVVRRLHLRRGASVADIGAGTGYFTVRLARAVGATGHVYAVDIDPRAVRYMRDRFRRAKLRQVTVIQAIPTDPKLPRPVDMIFMCDTLHHIENRPAYFQVLRHDLVAHGHLVIVDFKLNADLATGPPKAIRLRPELVTTELQHAGFRVVREPDFLPRQYMLNATLESLAPPATGTKHD